MGQKEGWSKRLRAALMGKMLDGGFGTSLVDSPERREERGLVLPECWLCDRRATVTKCPQCPARCYFCS